MWLWNILVDFASIRFQVDHGLGKSVWKPSWTIEYVLAQIGLIFPLALYWALKARRKLPHCLSSSRVGAVAIFLGDDIARIFGSELADRGVPCGVCTRGEHDSGEPARDSNHAAHLGSVARGTCIHYFVPASRGRSRSSFVSSVNSIRSRTSARNLEPLFARSYQMAAKMHFDLQRPVYKLRGMNRKDFYDFLPDSEPHERLYYLAVEKGDSLPLPFSSRGHKVAEVIPVDERFEIWKVVVTP